MARVLVCYAIQLLFILWKDNYLTSYRLLAVKPLWLRRGSGWMNSRFYRFRFNSFSIVVPLGFLRTFHFSISNEWCNIYDIALELFRFCGSAISNSQTAGGYANIPHMFRFRRWSVVPSGHMVHTTLIFRFQRPWVVQYVVWCDNIKISSYL